MNIRRFTLHELVTDLSSLECQLVELEKLDLSKLDSSQLDILEADVKANFITLRSLERNPRFHNHSLDQSELTKLLDRYRTIAVNLDQHDSSISSKDIDFKPISNFQRTMGKVGETMLEACFSVERTHNTHNLHFDFPDKVFKMLSEGTTSVPVMLHILKENDNKFVQLNYPQANLISKYLETLCAKTSDKKTLDLASSSLSKLQEVITKKLCCSEDVQIISESVEEFEADFKGFLL